MLYLLAPLPCADLSLGHEATQKLLEEGRQMVVAARKYSRIVQCATQAPTSSAVQEAVAWIQRGEIGPIRFGRVILYRERSSIGKVSGPTPRNPSVSPPAPAHFKKLLRRIMAPA